MDKKMNIFFMICVFLLLKSQISDGIKYKNKPSSRSYVGAQVLRVVPETEEHLKFLRSLSSPSNISFWLPPTKVNSNVDIQVESQAKDSLIKQLEERGLSIEVLIQNLANKVNENQIGLRSGGFFAHFKRLGQIYTFLDKIAAQIPDLASVHSIGKSFESRDIRVIKIGVNHQTNKKPVIYIDGGVHAREWAAVTTVCYIVHNLVKDFNKSENSVVNILNKYDIYLVPVVNPDGYEYTHTNDRMWRKNRAINPNSECIGTDVNRNYAFHFGGIGTSSDPCKETYGGPHAFSEPESRAVKKLILDNKSRMKAYLTLHSYGQYFLYPWGWTKANSDLSKELDRVAKISAKALAALYNTTYTIGSAAQVLYEAQGSDDWAHGAAQIPYVYCLEMRDEGKYGFILPASEIIPVGKETYVGIKALIEAIPFASKRKSTDSQRKGH